MMTMGGLNTIVFIHTVATGVSRGRSMHACLYYSSVNPIWCGFIITFARCFFAHFAVLRFLEQCAMIVSCTISVQTFFRRTSICEIVECYRSPKPVFWRRLGLRMTVISKIRGGKDHEATHDRQNLLIARLHGMRVPRVREVFRVDSVLARAVPREAAVEGY